MWKRATVKFPTAVTASSWKSSVAMGCRRETILPSIVAAADHRASRTVFYLRRFPDPQHLSQWCPSRLKHESATIPMHNGLLQRRNFQSTPTLQKSLSDKPQKKSKKGHRNSVSPKSKRPPPAHKMAASMGMTLQECSDYLVKECIELRSIGINKRQRLKPWIMALLVHRYDRGIRDLDELNTDSVYYSGGRSYNNSNPATNPPSIDLRNVLTPESTEIDEFVIATQDSSNNNRNFPKDKESIRELLRQEKLVLLATEARRILIDRDIPFRDLAELKNEAAVRKLSKQDPSVFLSLFSRAFCVSEKKGKKKRQGTPDFSHRRFQPPSLKASTHRKKKLKEKRDREVLAGGKIAKSEGNSFHRNSPKALQQKLRAMSQRNQ